MKLDETDNGVCGEVGEKWRVYFVDLIDRIAFPHPTSTHIGASYSMSFTQ